MSSMVGKRAASLTTFTVCAGENLPRGEERKQGAEPRGVERDFAAHEIVLVATERRAGVMVDIVLDE